MDNEVFCIVYDSRKRATYTGKADLSNLDVGKFLKNVYISEPITIEINGMSISGILSEIDIILDKLSNNIVKIILE